MEGRAVELTATRPSAIMELSGGVDSLPRRKKDTMAMINAQHEDLGNVILNTETNMFVLGSIGGTVAEFIVFDGGQALYRNAYPSHEAFMKDIEALHTDIVTELEADGYSVKL